MRRHADRKDTTKTGLTRRGINRAFGFGRGLVPNTKLYFGTAKRTQNTGRYATQTAKTVGIKYNPRQKAELTTSALKRIDWEEIVRSYGSKEIATRAWLDGKVPVDIVLPPAIAADKIIKKRLSLAYRLVKRKSAPRKLVLENITHQENMQAVIERLTGKSSEEFLQGKPIKHLERIGFTFTFPKGAVRIRLIFRGKEVDVTKRFEKIIALPKELEGAQI
ncbi:MAG: hypothetical protein WCW13_00585 [archaeon]